MSDTIKDLNPRFNGRKGKPRSRACIVGGLFIECKEGLRWYKDTYNHELAANHSEDMSVMMALWDELEKHGVADARRVCLLVPCTVDCHPEHTSGHNAWDFLVITYIERGPFHHGGIEECTIRGWFVAASDWAGPIIYHLCHSRFLLPLRYS